MAVEPEKSSGFSHFRIRELDSLRGLAAFLVVLFHCAMFRPQAVYGFNLGITGVDLFFIISGFVIFMSLENSKNGKLFLLGRFIRLYPIYWVIATLTFLLFFVLNLFDGIIPYTEIRLSNYLVNLTMFQYYFGVPNISGSYWTLIIELLFYFFIYVLFLFRALRFIVVTGVIFNALIFCLVLLIRNHYVTDFTDVFPLIYHFPMFFTGILFYRMYTDQGSKGLLFLLTIACLALQLYLADYGRAVQFISLPAYMIMLSVYAGIFLLFVWNRLHFIVNRGTIFLGDISYTLYLVHQPVCYCLIIPYLTDIRGWNFWLATFGVAVPVSIAAAGLLTYFVEKPLRSYMRKKWMNH